MYVRTVDGGYYIIRNPVEVMSRTIESTNHNDSYLMLVGHVVTGIKDIQLIWKNKHDLDVVCDRTSSAHKKKIECSTAALIFLCQVS